MEKLRKFEVVSKYHECDINLPVRQTNGSAGYDIQAAETIVIPPYQLGVVPVLVHTGIKVCIPEDEVLLLFNRSSNPLKRNLILPNGVGVIDSDYYNNPANEGEIMGQFVNLSSEPITIKKGERIMQGVFVKYGVTVNDIPANEKRLGGFGSTGNTSK